MRKYDVTGVGLHLGTAEEFVRKTGLQLPLGHDESEVSAMTVLPEPQILPLMLHNRGIVISEVLLAE